MTAPRVIVAGSVAQRPGQGGHTWLFLQYVIGLRELGCEVLFVDRLSPEMCRDAAGAPSDFAASENLAYWRRVMDGFGLGAVSSLIYDHGKRVEGVPLTDVRRFARSSAVLLNVMGFLDDEDIREAAALRVFVDIDPGFTQMWHALEQTHFLDGHDAFVTVGGNIGAADCTIPDCGRQWIPWRPPVVLELWPRATGGHRDVFTSVGAWRGPYAPVAHDGRTYGLRVHEFRKFAAVPSMAKGHFELALDIDPSDERDRRLLAAGGWRLVDPAVVASDPWVYREYVSGSHAEFQVAKGIYVETRSGWFSDRSACYLAAGRPVVAQATGVDARIPVGEGLLTFRTPEEARDAVDAVERDYARHSRAARALAEERFDSRRVLGELLSELGVT